MDKNALIIFAREPKLGCVKTRLAAELGRWQTLALYKAFIEDICAMAKRVEGVDCFIFYQGQLGVKSVLGRKKDAFVLQAQRGADLGARMHMALETVFKKGYEKAAIIGTDCLTITPEDVQAAFQRLDRADIVLGPSYDGGYYLLGCKKAYKGLFSRIRWGTEDVLSATLRRIRQYSWRVSLLKKKRDIDYFDDLRYLKAVDYKAIVIPHTRAQLRGLSAKF